MRAWLDNQLDPIRASDRRVATVLDPEAVVSANDLLGLGQVITATDWYELRRAYEQHGRGRPPDQPRLVILVRDEKTRETGDLAYDIANASEVIRVGVPVSPQFHQLVLELPDDYASRAIAVLRTEGRDPIRALVADLWGVILSEEADATREVEVVVRLRTDPTVPPSLWPFLGARLQSPLARELAMEPPNLESVQNAWADWLRRGEASVWATVFESLGPRIAPLLFTGLLQPARSSATTLPRWVRLGSLDISPVDRVNEQQAAAPKPSPPTDMVGWLEVAKWWGEIRAALAEGDPETAAVRPQAWSSWQNLDGAFLRWLQAEFGRLMLRSAPMPITVDKISHFLARRMRDGQAARILLIVVDGMAFAQWSSLRRALGLRVLQAGASFAMIPTLTPISRQAIFGGQLPKDFRETIKKTSADRQAWEKFWQRDGRRRDAIRYYRVSGASASDLPNLEGAEVVGIVVSAIDELMHGSHLLGDPQLTSGVLTWARQGYLRALLQQAVRASFEVWITADHGNIESLPLGLVHEGLAVESAGVRVRWYPNSQLRQGARTEGIIWDPPGLPDGVCYPLFARGRGGYFTGNLRVTHGGLSLDEVIVPLMRVAL